MNIIQVKIDFEQGTCQKQGISVVTGDYNSTKVVFEFNESATGRKVFEMKNPNDELVYADEIVNNEVVLVGYTEENGETTTYSLFNEEGDYTFEVSLYQDNSKLTSVCDYITANKEQVIIDGETAGQALTLFDNLMNELDTAITETNNLNLDAEKVDTTTTVTLTKKDGTPKEVEILDGVSLEDIEIVNRYLIVTYGGETDNLGQVQPNVQVGTTTTIAPSMQARVEVTGDSMNPVLNFYIPKGEAGAIKTQIVQTLPLTGSDDTIYLLAYTEITVQELPSTGAIDTIYIVENTGKRYVYENGKWNEIGSDNKFAEYLWINNAWERLGGISVNIDLQDYYTKSEVDLLLGGKQDKLTEGLYITIDNNNTIDVKDVVRTNGNDHIYGNKTFEYYPTTNATTPTSNGQLVNKGWVDSQLSGKQNTIDNDHKLPYSLISGTPTIPTKTSELTNDSDFVSNTDYATTNKGGVIKTSGNYGVDIYNGYLLSNTKTYEIYQSAANSLFVSKGTLENVISGKQLETQTNKVTTISSQSTDTQYPSAKCVYDIVGDIETILTTLDVGSGV